MKTSELCVPVKALALPAETGSDVPPAVGDEVDFSGTGTVSRIEGEGPDAKAYLTPRTINGEAIETAAPEKEMTIDDEESELRADAKKADSQPRIY